MLIWGSIQFRGSWIKWQLLPSLKFSVSLPVIYLFFMPHFIVNSYVYTAISWVHWRALFPFWEVSPSLPVPEGHKDSDSKLSSVFLHYCSPISLLVKLSASCPDSVHLQVEPKHLWIITQPVVSLLTLSLVIFIKIHVVFPLCVIHLNF